MCRGRGCTVDDVYSGVVIEKMALRKAEMQEYTQHAGKTRLTFIAPSRGLIGYQSDFRTDTRGSGVMNRSVSHYGPFIKELGRNSRGALISSTAGEATAYTLQALEPRGQLFVAPGAEVCSTTPLTPSHIERSCAPLQHMMKLT